jgi:hypothetical protein
MEVRQTSEKGQTEIGQRLDGSSTKVKQTSDETTKQWNETKWIVITMDYTSNRVVK